MLGQSTWVVIFPGTSYPICNASLNPILTFHHCTIKCHGILLGRHCRDKDYETCSPMIPMIQHQACNFARFSEGLSWSICSIAPHLLHFVADQVCSTSNGVLSPYIYHAFPSWTNFMSDAYPKTSQVCSFIRYEHPCTTFLLLLWHTFNIIWLH